MHMNKGEKKGLVPRLRFPEFGDSEEWEEKALAEVADFVNTKISVKELKANQYISTENVLQDFAGIESSNTLPSVNNVTGFGIGDILISNIRPYLKKIWFSNMVGGASNDILVVRAKKINPIFLSFLLKSDEFISYMTAGAKGVKMPRGDVSLIKRYPIFVPQENINTKKSEQQKIADCLASLDGLITEEGKKLEALRAHKKGLTQKLFPAEGQTVPKWRFPEFRGSGEWEECTLGSSCDSFSGGTPDTSIKEYYGGNIPFIRSAEIEKETTELFITQIGFENSAAKMVQAGDVLVALYGANSGEVSLSKIDGAINQAIICLRHGSSNAFVYQYLFHKKNRIISTYIQGGQGNLSGEIIKSIELYFPKSKEQQKIADCLSSIDDLITEQAKKIGALKIYKKGLMQGLFPSIEEVGE